jgi:tRNA-splicing ligase RtcB (3'-phosphate/5'-hydroxy nucleic acid ligase)
MPQMIAPRVLSWATDIDQKTTEQAARSAQLPFIEGHVALMPDAHFGYGATVGSVIPTRGAIIPSAIGVDIGCGMIAARLDLTSEGLPDDLGSLHSGIARAVPAGVGKGHDDFALSDAMPDPSRASSVLDARLVQKALKQFGSLGSGNHFVEICLDEMDRVWIVLHSGSRGVGNELANIHIDGAKALMARYFIDLPDPDLAYLIEGTPEFDAYISDMLWSQEYALGNRKAMLEAVWGEVNALLGWVHMVDLINCHHNFTEREHHHGRNVWLTRKGAIRARPGDRGVIPGSMGAASFIVRGRGSEASYDSCSHGAGRRLSRGRAKRTLTPSSLDEAMAGKTWNGDALALLDEHPDAYKDIDEVMAAQADLVRIEHRLHSILNYKGV